MRSRASWRICPEDSVSPQNRIRGEMRCSEVSQRRHKDPLDVGRIGGGEDRAAGRLADLAERGDVGVLAVSEAQDVHLAVVLLLVAQALQELLEGQPAAWVVIAAV